MKDRVDALCSRAPRYAIFTAARRECLSRFSKDLAARDAVSEARALVTLKKITESDDEISEETMIAGLLAVSEAAAALREAGFPARTRSTSSPRAPRGAS